MQAYKLDPRDPAVPYALALLYAQDRRWTEALRWAELLQAVDPANPQAQQLVERLRAEARAGAKPGR